MEEWRIIDHSINKSVVENMYYISSFGRIKCDGNIYNPEYKSSNGYNYTFMNCINGNVNLFPVDELVVRAFSLIPEQLMHSHIEIFHLNGNNRDDYVDNLSVSKFYRKWKIITYPRIAPNAYEISNDGMVKSLYTHKLHNYQVDSRYGYVFTSLKHTDGSHRHEFVHRLVAWEFAENRNPDYDVNHINGNKQKNYYKNLEWIDRKDNINHAKVTGLNNIEGSNSPLAKFDDELIEYICEKLVEFKGDIMKVLKDLNDKGIFEVSRWNIESIKYKRHWKNISDKFFNEGAFDGIVKKRQGSPVLDAEKVKLICKTLVLNDMDVYKTYQKLFNIIPGLSESQIYKIKKKYNWRNISENYF